MNKITIINAQKTTNTAFFMDVLVLMPVNERTRDELSNVDDTTGAGLMVVMLENNSTNTTQWYGSFGSEAII